jgi:cyclophilin family peptidyl-prolyl cis-trans isomerase
MPISIKVAQFFKQLIRQIFALLMIWGLSSSSTFATTVRMQTSLGTIDIQLMDVEAPATVANFLHYVNSAAYNNSFIHRSVPGFIVQGGGYLWNTSKNSYTSTATYNPVINEYSPSRSNLRGTIAMAKLGGDPNSATNQWFFNLGDNSKNLDNQNGGFTVFGRVTSDTMPVVDAIAALTIVNANGANSAGPFSSLPLVTTPSAGITDSNLVMIRMATVLPDPDPVTTTTTTTTTIALTTTTTRAATGHINVAANWNLIGNGYETNIQVSSLFGDASVFTSVWKWVSGKWAFYSPSMDAPTLTNYAAAKGYEVLSQINAGEGFWVNAKQATTLSIAQSSPVTSSSFNANGSRPLGTSWSLIATGDNPTPAAFNNALSLTPPLDGAPLPQNLTSLWAWDSNSSTPSWYFWAPNLENAGTLQSYATGKGYLDFTTNSKTLAPGVGLWVNKP